MAGAIFRALFHVLDKGLPREENIAELALHGDSVLKDALVDLDRVYFLGKSPVALLNVGDGL